MNVCFVCCEYPPGPHGGIGSSVQNLARALVAAGHEARVVGVYPASYPAPDYEEDAGVRVWRLREQAYRLGWVADRWRVFKIISTWCKQGKVDVVDVPDWMGFAAAWPKLPAPVVARLCGAASYFAAELGQPIRRLIYRLERSSLRRADFVCSKSIYTAARTRALFRLPGEADAVIYNPATLPESAGEERAKERVVFTGTLAEKKGVLSLARAWPDVVQRVPEAELHLFGKDARTADGESMREHVQVMLEANGTRVRASVRFHGHVSRRELTRTLMTCRMAVFPSYAEAFANGPLESMACGCPTIYSTRGSGPELIDDGRNGLLVDPDDTTALASAIVRVLQDDGLATRLGAQGRETVRERFSLESVLRRNEEFYRGCVEQFSSSRRRLRRFTRNEAPCSSR